MTLALAAWCGPDGFLPCQSDSDRIDARDIMAHGALLFHDGTLKHYFKMGIAREGAAAKRPLAKSQGSHTLRGWLSRPFYCGFDSNELFSNAYMDL